ncbi:type 1 glutamine amidotransferase [uncultured Desulfuromusa sp.]|uniref:type 1 glutamine amidotransferase n=1 Tax=uncultured Desulfuromusa sp. TaxID=219183 RepID=UPI002AA80151|nr:type 1 glutamine amidotransferase [uncultured Desulfuromusa sp.]
MNIHYLQHVPFEGLGSMEAALIAGGHQLSSTHLYKNQRLPSLKNIDWLIVMGGPMGIHDEAEYPWLLPEKKFIQQAIESGKTVLGVCLGAQLIAAAMGAEVYKNDHKEIGWFSINRSPEADTTIIATAIPQQAEVFHWHGDTFNVPAGAKSLASSNACQNQGFIFDDRVVGLQFHLETTPELIQELINNSRHELDCSSYVQSEEEMLANPQRFARINQIMAAILETLEKNTNNR